MGANGTASVFGSIPADERQYESGGTFDDPVFGEVEIVEWKGPNNKSPEESNSAPRIYVTFDKKGNGINSISKYGEDHKKEWEIHTVPHDSKAARKKGEAVDGPHVHKWKDGAPTKVEPLRTDDPRFGLLQRLQDFKKLKK